MNGSSDPDTVSFGRYVYDAWVAERISSEETEHAVAALEPTLREEGGHSNSASERDVSRYRWRIAATPWKALHSSRWSSACGRRPAWTHPITVADFSKVAVKGEFGLRSRHGRWIAPTARQGPLCMAERARPHGRDGRSEVAGSLGWR